MPKRYLSLLVAVALVLGSGALAAANNPPAPDSYGWDDYDPADGPRVQEDDHQHGATDGHLPASNKNIQLVGKLKLTNVPGGIADVTAFGNYAYLNAWAPECAGRTGAAAHGPGTHVVDVSNPASPTKVGFLTSPPNTYPGEGAHVIEYNGRRYFLNNSEVCNAASPATAGMNLWDVTNPAAGVLKGSFGENVPPVANQTHHTYHSVQGFVWNGKAYAVGTDNQDLKDVDIFDVTPLITGAGPAVLVAEQGLEDWPGAQGSYANGDSVFHHDMQQKVIDGTNYLLVSYWDAGQVLLNVNNPAAPVFVTDSDYSSPDPEQPAFEIPEGNSHQSYFDQDGDYVISTDEDFSPTRTLCRITTGPNAGDTGCGEFGWTPDLADLYPSGFTGDTVFGGLGCTAGSFPSQAVSGRDAIVFSRGTCTFSTKVKNGQDAGYDLVAIGQSHVGARNGLLPDAFICGSQGEDYDEQIPAICIGHRAMHQLFNSPPNYTGSEGADIAIGTPGETLFARGGVFDGWGYTHLHSNTTDLPELDTYSIPEAQDPAYASGFGSLTVHEVKTDPRLKKDIAYFSYYNAGLRVATFGPGGITEVGHYIADGGNDFWGVYPLCAGQCLLSEKDQGQGKDFGKRPLILMSDRDSGLWIFRYTGKE